MTSKIWLIYKDGEGEWQAEAVADVGDPSAIPLPVDISISSDDSGLWVNTFMDGTTRLFDMTDPHNPQQVYEKAVGSQVNMASPSWDGRRVYYTSSLLANWDKKGEKNEQYFKSLVWDGDQLVEKYPIEFTEEKLGRAHQMRFGAYSLCSAASPEAQAISVAKLDLGN